MRVLLKGATELIECQPADFEKLFGVTYQPHLTFANWRAERFLRHKCHVAHKKGHINKLALWLGRLHSKQLKHNDIHNFLSIKYIDPTFGYGVFSERSLKEFEFIGEYTGLIRRRRLLFPDINDYCFMYPREWFSLKAYTIDSAKQGNFTRFINHSDTPNLESVGVYLEGLMHIMFRTLRPIPAGAELTYDYGEVYWQDRDKAS